MTKKTERLDTSKTVAVPQTAAGWLTTACRMEAEGHASRANMALNRAIKVDETEEPHSLSRTK